MARQKQISVNPGKYTISEACVALNVPPKTLQGAVTRGDMAKKGMSKSLLPKKDRKGVWHIPAMGLIRWFNDMYLRRPKNVTATMGTPAAAVGA